MYKIEATPGTISGVITATVTTPAGVEIATGSITTDAGDLTTDTAGEEYESIIAIGDVTTEMNPSTEYKIVIEYDGGDASNYIAINAVDTNTPMLSLKPGMPPKAEFGLVHEDRLHCIEGVTGTNPSYRWYCAAGNQLDWSTANGGGYTPVIDQSATNYPIAAVASWNEDLWFFGTPQQPYLGKQSGTTPSVWQINKTMQKVSGSYRSTVVTSDNIIFLHPAGVDMISSVQESADIAAESQSDNIRSTIQQYFSSAAFAGYDPEWGLYMLKMAGTDDIYAIHTRAKSVKYSGRKSTAFSPVTRWQYAFDGTPTAFGHGNGFMLIGTDGGKVYKMDKDITKDDGAAVTYRFITSSKPTVFGEAQAYGIGYRIFGKYGGACNIKFYRDYSRTSFQTLPFNLPIDTTMLTADFDDVLTAEADFYLTPDQYFDRENINFNYRNLMVGVEDIELWGGPLYFGEINLLSRAIGGF